MTSRSWNSDDRVCHYCVGSPGLKEFIKREGQIGACANCKRRAKAVSFDNLASQVDEVYREMYRPGGESGYGQLGDYPEEIIRELIQDDGTDIPDALAKYLNAGEWPNIKDGGDALYDSGTRYVQIDLGTNPAELTYAWSEFEDRTKYGRRFFDPQLTTYLGELMQIIDSVRVGVRSDLPLIYSLKRGTEIFRAREAVNFEDAEKILSNPSTALGPAPRGARSKGGRMNAPGICTFYGSMESDTCIAEMRPSVGSLVVVGQFRLLRAARILDLTRLDFAVVSGDPFSSGYFEKVRSLRFLKIFHDIVSQPVHPARESIAYVPTQLLADYLANIGELDGVIFRSAQFGRQVDDAGKVVSSQKNIAFFNAESIVGERRKSRVPAQNSTMWDLPIPRFSELRPPLMRYVQNSASVVKVVSAAPKTAKFYMLSQSGFTAEDFDDDVFEI